MRTASGVTMVKLVLDQLQGFLHDQIQRLIGFGYHTALSMDEETFTDHILKTAGKQIPEFLEVEEHQLPILLVIPSGVLSLEVQMGLLGIESDYQNPVWDINERTTLNHPYLIYGVEYRVLGNIFPENAPQHPELSHWQVLSFVQGLAIIAQCEELLQHCESLIFAGSFWFTGGVKQVPELSCHDTQRRIIGRVTYSSYPCSDFGVCKKG